MAESIDVKMARVEEGLVRVHEKFDHADRRAEARHQTIMSKIDLIVDRQWQMYAKMAGIAAVVSILSRHL